MTWGHGGGCEGDNSKACKASRQIEEWIRGNGLELAAEKTEVVVLYGPEKGRDCS